MVSQDRRHLFVTPWVGQATCSSSCFTAPHFAYRQLYETLHADLNALVPGRVEEANSQVTGRLLSQPPVNQLSNLLLHFLYSKKMKK
jgi:hypothetical protein